MSEVKTRPQGSQERDHSMFEAELSGAVLNMHLLGRLMHWLKPYRLSLVVSAILILLASTVAVAMEVVISRVLIDYIIVGNTGGEAEVEMPDLGMIALTQWLEAWLGIEALFAAGLLFAVL
ncbi:MAG: hypothetical protein HUJ31_04805, partial [Pseudomonadales bacterium]|nr:hypothetical protein [Pseudomonadales bacterium]